jgi:hypothetical protein
MSRKSLGMKQSGCASPSSNVPKLVVHSGAKHKEDPLIHSEYDPELWLEAGISNELNKNLVYGISMTMV